MPRVRKGSVRRVKSRIYIFCEGKKTEPNYIRAYIEAFYPACVRLKDVEKPVTIQDTRKNTPKQLVEEAATFAKKLDFPGDQVWVMYDREAVEKYPDQDHAQAWKMAQNKQIKVVLSNVCFEYWLLLHLKATSQPATNCDELISSKHFKQAIRELGFSSYEKGQAEIAAVLMTHERIEHAKKHARRINQQTISEHPQDDAELPYRLSPFTNVYEVLEAIDQVAI